MELGGWMNGVRVCVVVGLDGGKLMVDSQIELQVCSELLCGTKLCLPARRRCQKQIEMLPHFASAHPPPPAADLPKREICTMTLTSEQSEEFVDAVQRHYW